MAAPERLHPRAGPSITGPSRIGGQVMRDGRALTRRGGTVDVWQVNGRASLSLPACFPGLREPLQRVESPG